MTLFSVALYSVCVRFSLFFFFSPSPLFFFFLSFFLFFLSFLPSFFLVNPPWSHYFPQFPPTLTQIDERLWWIDGCTVTLAGFLIGQEGWSTLKNCFSADFSGGCCG